jgi:hypothetical protein
MNGPRPMITSRPWTDNVSPSTARVPACHCAVHRRLPDRGTEPLDLTHGKG